MAPRTTPINQRFWDKINKTDSCWIWSASTTRGYGRLMIKKNVTIAAHRYSAMLHFGMFDSRLLVLHKCDNPACVNPEHLFLGTEKDNMVDMVSKGRSFGQKKTHCKHGHEYTKNNTIMHNGGRECRTCISVRKKKDYQKKKSLTNIE